MKIALVIISDGWGGAEAVVYGLAQRLTEKEHQICIVLNREMLPFYRELEHVQLFDIGTFYRFRSWSLSGPWASSRYRVLGRLIYLVCSYLDELQAFILRRRKQGCLMRILLDRKIKVVHSHLRDSAFLCSHLDRTGVFHLSTFHGEHDLLLPGRRRVVVYSASPPLKFTRFSVLLTPLIRFRLCKLRKGLTSARTVTTVSNLHSRILCAWQPELRAKITVVPNGIDIPDIRKDVAEAVVLKGAFNLIFPGGAKPRKGGILLLLALARLKGAVPTVHAYFTGHIPYDHPLRNAAASMGLTQIVTFTGFLTRKEYRALLKSVDLLVMPSVEEAFGLVYLEAMALGKPIIALRSGVVAELVKDGRNGILVDLDAQQIASAVLHLQRNDRLRESIAINNLQDSKRFDWGSVAERYLELYKGLVRNR
jgi:glycosyltransferase involved in cell wall biosynthesis